MEELNAPTLQERVTDLEDQVRGLREIANSLGLICESLVEGGLHLTGAVDGIQRRLRRLEAKL